MELAIQSVGVERIAGATPARISSWRGQTIEPQRIKLQTWQCSCDPGTDNCVCTSEFGQVRTLNLLLGNRLR
jgi:hypothetical protein